METRKIIEMLAQSAAPILVSACLVGEACRYDGGATPHPMVLRLLEQGRAVPVCPEVLGGLCVPRDPVELRDGQALCRSGREVTAEIQRGAMLALASAQERSCCGAILKSRSPSCGVGIIYDGTFSGALVPGDGMLAALLKAHGIAVCSELQLPQD